MGFHRDTSLQGIIMYLLYDGTRGTRPLQTYSNFPYSFYVCSTIYAHPPASTT